MSPIERFPLATPNQLNRPMCPKNTDPQPTLAWYAWRSSLLLAN